MFYEEREFDDGWYYRTTPGGQWIRGRPSATAPMTAPPAGALEACPFCGREAHLTFDKSFGGFVSCSTEGCAGNAHAAQHDRSQIIAAWNRRTHGPALLAALRLREWRPIAEAPKDGTWVELTGGIIDYGWEGDQPPTVSGQYSTEWERWHFAWYDGGYYGKYEKPALWRPLSPPTADDLARILEEGE